MTGPLLAVNAGSSSLKFAFYGTGSGACERIARGLIDFRRAEPLMTLTDGTGTVEMPAGPISGAADPRLADLLFHAAEARHGHGSPLAVGHRIVHGGDGFVAPARLDEAALDALDRLAPFAPGHQPAGLAFVRAAAARWPGVPQIGCFDTAFHHGMPDAARRYALPRDLADIRRYGFHGLSYAAIHARLGQVAPDLAAGRVIVAHLGSGASLCAMNGGRSVDTTMGLTALDGLPMATRCGALDPGAVLHLIADRGMPPGEVAALLYKRSGLLGVSGISGDMRRLLDSPAPEAAEAVEMFVFRIAREIGALAASLGGVDGIVFTGGIGENATAIRAAVAARCAWLGAVPDDEANAHGRDRFDAPASRIQLWRLATDEEGMIARQALAAVSRH